ncbi:DNA/RNA non-specific endonuclease [Halodesulfovibrio sp.]|jgi:endonuclease G|uniref:DNA/RNA non-specific endonuclease n=1 Tax=Halodesulfovibrio sp. TaxID=1912772 RepID=UPI0025E240D9|nr:DNA/RNA non-specific endonuclease [Halodesulfovibrio sp.]MCT4625853.1 DNA/RNA non-specific endonuclease [Halodesulfovibrio sp.]
MYEFTQEEANAPRVKRTNSFRSDPAVPSGSAALSDYKKSGYDRGHLAPAADMGFSKQAMSESFYMSNMSPQRPGFNRGIWKKLEEIVRGWAKNEDIIIVTGGILTGRQYIGSNAVLIPNTYYKVIYAPQRQEMIAFLLPNEASSALLQHFALPVDAVEAVAGIDFFPTIPDEFEAALERNINTSSWQWTAKPSQIRKQRSIDSSTMGVVKMSRSGICHDRSSRYYSRTKHFTPYRTLKECLNAGGRLPR